MIIAIEGIDGVGKGTQSELLALRLNESGHATSLISFPDYESTTGQSIKKYLSGQMGVSGSHIAATLFALNRVEYFYDNNIHLEENIVFNRYVLSNLVYQSYRIKDLERRKAFVDWQLDLEYEKFKLPRPDLTIILDLNVEESLYRLRKRQGDKVDIHENRNMLDYARCTYNYFAANDNTCIVIDCLNTDSLPKTVYQVYKDIWQTVVDHFKLTTKT